MDRMILAIIGVTVLVLGGILLIVKRDPSTQLATTFSGDDTETISEGGVHWHPKLSITIKGEPVEIPDNVGIGSDYADHPFYHRVMHMTTIHTHSSDGTLHWEIFQGPIKKGHARLKAFFDIWGQPFDREHLMEKSNGSDGTVRMSVNGQPNDQFEQYVVQDGDEIEIRYE